MEDLDLEEIESRLYSQVFHSVPDENEQDISIANTVPTEIFSNTPPPVRKVTNYSVNNAHVPKKPNRYWDPTKNNQTNLQFNQTQNQNEETAKPGSPKPQNSRPQTPKNQILDPQMDKPQKLGCETPKSQMSNRSTFQKTNEKNQIIPRNNFQNQNIPEFMPLDKKSKHKQRRLRKKMAKLASKMKFVDIPPFSAVQKFQNKPNPKIKNEVNVKLNDSETIVLSDSESDDDVVYVEQPKKPIYVIESDSDESQSESEILDQNSTLNTSTYEKIANLNLGVENNSSELHESGLKTGLLNQGPTENLSNEAEMSICNSSLNDNFNFGILPEVSENNVDDNEVSSTINCSETLRDTSPINKPAPLRNVDEISCTPDSTNDFIDDFNLDKQSHFNFSLHDPDLDISLKDSSLSASKSEIFDTESSCCSESVILTPTKNLYDTPNDNLKNIFSGDDLTTFSNFITPKRNNDSSKRKSLDFSEKIPTKASKMVQNEITVATQNENVDHSVQKQRVMDLLKNCREKLTLEKKRSNKDNVVIETWKQRIDHLNQVLHSLESNKNCSESNVNQTALTEDVTEITKSENTTNKNNSTILEEKLDQENISFEIPELSLNSENKSQNSMIFTNKTKLRWLRRKQKRLKEVIEDLKKTGGSPNCKGKLNKLHKKLQHIENLLKKSVTPNEVVQNLDPEKNISKNEGPQKIDSESKISEKAQQAKNESNVVQEKVEPAFKTQGKVVVIEDFDDESNPSVPQPENTQNNSENSPDKQDDSFDISSCSSDESDDFCNDFSFCDNSENNGDNLVLNISAETPSTSKRPAEQDDRDLVRNPFSKDNSRKNFSDFWTDDMEKFYDKSWGQENFNVDEIIANMPADPAKWKVIDADKNTFKIPNKRKYCTFCRRSGHMSYDCPKLNSKEAIRCAICGDEGHLRSRCPNLMCTTCGSKGGYLTTSCHRCKHFSTIRCNICQLQGHPDRICPDLWRRHHLSENENGPLTRSEAKLKPGKDQWCSGCARRGHLYHNCHRTVRDHFLTLPYIIDYKPTYNGQLKLNQGSTDQNKSASDHQIPSLMNMKFSELKNYRNFMENANQQKYRILIKKLMHECESENKEQYLGQLRSLEKYLDTNNDFSKKLGHLHRLRKIIRKSNYR